MWHPILFAPIMVPPRRIQPRDPEVIILVRFLLPANVAFFSTRVSCIEFCLVPSMCPKARKSGKLVAPKVQVYAQLWAPDFLVYEAADFQRHRRERA
jgi:hypothetical protein